MSVREEILALEEGLRLAELGTDPAFFTATLADEMLMDGQRHKARIVAAHQPGSGNDFTNIEMRDFDVVDHGNAAVVTCTGVFEGPRWSGTLRFQRTWLKKDGRWQVIACSTLK